MQQPRQLYGLGSLVKSIGKTVKKVIKSPIGKAALIGAAAFGIPGTQFGGLLGRGAGMFGSAPSIFGKTGGITALLGGGKAIGPAGKYGTTSALSNLFGKIPGGGYTVGAIGSILAASGMGPEEIEETKRDPEKVKIYLRDYYSKTNPDASSEEVEEFVTTNTSEYMAVGGRVGLTKGGDVMKAIDKGISPDMALDIYEEFKKIKEKHGYTMSFDQYLDGEMFATGGRVGLESGTPKKGLDSLTKGPFKNKNKNKKRKYIRDGVEFDKPLGERGTFNTGNPPKRYEVAFGGIPGMPMGQMRKNKAGTIERDYRETGGFVPVGIKEKADDVPAMLSKNEFVMTADAVRGIGGGNIEKGAQKLYDQMKTAEKRVV